MLEGGLRPGNQWLWCECPGYTEAGSRSYRHPARLTLAWRACHLWRCERPAGAAWATPPLCHRFQCVARKFAVVLRLLCVRVSKWRKLLCCVQHKAQTVLARSFQIMFFLFGLLSPHGYLCVLANNSVVCFQHHTLLVYFLLSTWPRP